MGKRVKREIDYLPKKNWRYAFGMSAVAAVALWFADADTYYGSILASLPVLGGLWVNGKSARLGWRGERSVGRHLAAILPDEYVILHDVVFPKTQVDYVVIGPGGVMVIEVKNWTGTLDADPYEEYWKLHNKRTGHVYEPKNAIHQNYGHAKQVEMALQIMGIPDDVYGMVVIAPDPIQIRFTNSVKHISKVSLDDFRCISRDKESFRISDAVQAIQSASECHVYRQIKSHKALRPPQ